MDSVLGEILKIGGPSAVALIILYLIVREFTAILKNHIQHNTSVLKEVSERTKQDTDATKENTRVLQGLKETLLKINGNSKK